MNTKKNISVIGSRAFNNYELLKTELDKIKDGVKLIISGGANGADKLAEWAKENSIETKIYLPDLKPYGKSTCIARNRDIIANADMVFAFWDGKSKGTKFSIDWAKKLSKEVVLIGNNHRNYC